MERKYFGTDGVRGRVGDEPITPATVMKLGWAVGRVLGAGSSNARILIGKDTRVSGYMLESALEAGLSAAGVDISLIGPMPTPGIAYLTRTSRAQAGIVISASHNPYFDNGIKFFSAKGQKLPDDVELEIEQAMGEPMSIVESASLGKAERFADAAGRYIEFCKSTVPYRLTLKELRLVVDCAHGAAYHVAPNVFEELGADVTAIGHQPDGFNINEQCGSTHPQALQAKVLETQADIGIALDGDGDRLILVDAMGEIVDGDEILYIMSQHRLKKSRLNGGLVGTLMTNLGLEQACARANIPFVRAAVGDRYVLEQLAVEQWELGGETSGHIICLDKTTTGDAIIAALELLQVMVNTGKSLNDLKTGMEKFPQKMINVRLENGKSSQTAEIIDCASVGDAVKQAQSELSSNGRVVLRPSGTEPLIRVMVEGNNSSQVDRITRQLAQTVETTAKSLG